MRKFLSIMVLLVLFATPVFGETVAISIDTWSPDLMETLTVVNSYTHTLSVSEDSQLRVYGHIDCHHRGISGTANGPVMIAMQVYVDGVPVDGSKTGLNIVGVVQHYGIIPVHAVIDLDPGMHTVEIWMRSASSLAPGVNGLAEIKAGYNEVVYELTPAN